MAVSHAGSQRPGAAALAQVTSDATKEGESRANRCQSSRRDRTVPWPADMPERLCAARMWLQLGIASPEARAIAEQAGLLYVEDRCLIIEQRRLQLRAPGTR